MLLRACTAVSTFSGEMFFLNMARAFEAAFDGETSACFGGDEVPL